MVLFLNTNPVHHDTDEHQLENSII